MFGKSLDLSKPKSPHPFILSAQTLQVTGMGPDESSLTNTALYIYIYIYIYIYNHIVMVSKSWLQSCLKWTLFILLLIKLQTSVTESKK